MWVKEGNAYLRSEKFTLPTAGCHKLEKIWSEWLDTPGVAPMAVMCDRFQCEYFTYTVPITALMFYCTYTMLIL